MRQSIAARVGEGAMDPVALSEKMKRLRVWLDRRCQPNGFIQRQFDGIPFGNSYVTIDPSQQESAASFNLNRVYLCGMDGLAADGLQRLTELFTGAGVRRFFAWLSPGPDMDKLRGSLASS